MTALLVDEPLPPYSYVPGKFPHPLHDPRGHQMSVPPVHWHVPFDPQQWRTYRAYLRGIDLFNHGYYWESHEAWEAVWQHAGRQGPAADFLKALIKLAAALVKAREGRIAGVRRHARRALELLQSTAADNPATPVMGLALPALAELARSLAETPDQFVNPSSDPVVQLVTTPLRLATQA